MSSNWKKVKLSTLCERIGDGLHGTPQYSETSNIFFINGNNIKNGKILYDNETKKVDTKELEKNFIKLNKNSLLISINGTLGNMAFYKGENIMLGKSAAYLNFKTNINQFYYYYFQLPNIQKYFYDVATGSTIKNLSLKSLQDFEVPIPDNNEYQKIASVLSALDDKIELNNRINAELEAMAKTLYDYWFVQFDFPVASTGSATEISGENVASTPLSQQSDEKNTAAELSQRSVAERSRGYKSSGGKMVYNETLKREIPEGWKVKSVGEFAKIKKGTLITEKTANTNGNVKVVSAGLDFSYFHSESNFPNNTISISASGANAGYINFWREPIFACDCTTVRGNSDFETFYILQFLKSVQEFIYSQARGSAQPHVYPKDIEALKIIIPNEEILHKYGEIVYSMNVKITNNLKQNQELSALRDWLLPMLMNGQVKVG